MHRRKISLSAPVVSCLLFASIATGCGTESTGGLPDPAIPNGFPSLAPETSSSMSFTLDGAAHLFNQRSITGFGDLALSTHTVVFDGATFNDVVLMHVPSLTAGIYDDSDGLTDISLEVANDFYSLGSLCGSSVTVTITGSSDYAAWGSVAGTVCDPADSTLGVGFTGTFSALLPGVTTYDMQGL